MSTEADSVQYRDKTKSCCIIGGGIAGVTAAIKLAEEGVDVTIIEKKAYLLGRTGGWEIKNENLTDCNGEVMTVPMQYGYHAVFPSYTSFKELLAKANIPLIYDSDYHFYCSLDEKYAIGLVRGNWVQKVWIMWRMNMFSIWDLNFSVICFMLCCVFYNEKLVQRWYKDMTFKDFAKWSRFPKLLHRVFRTVARSMFNPEEAISVPKMILSNYHYLFKYKEGMRMQAFADYYGQELNIPLEKMCNDLNVTILKNTAVTNLSKSSGSMFSITTENSGDKLQFSSVILATDMRTAEELVRNSFQHEVFPAKIPRTQYINARVWVEATKTDDSLPTVFSTFGTKHLDFAFFVHEREAAAKAWAEQGSNRMVMEIHSYYFPPTDNVEDDILSVLLEEIKTYVTITKMYHKEIVTGRGAAHTTHHMHQLPPVDGFFLAGDYTCKTAFLLEGAVRSGNDSAADCLKFLEK